MGKHRKSNAQSEHVRALEEAQEMDRRAQELLDAAHARTPKVETLSSTLRKMREKNHFGEMVYDAVMGRP